MAMAKKRDDVVVSDQETADMVVMESPHGDRKECPFQVVEYLRGVGWKPIDEDPLPLPSVDGVAKS